MSVTETVTKLSVDRFYQVIGLMPYHGNQLLIPDSLDPDGRHRLGCSSVIYQFRWQHSGGVPGREDIAQAILDAERALETKLHFPLMPVYFTERLWLGGDQAFPMRTQLEHYYFRQSAVRASTLVEAGVALAFEDRDGDTYDETVVVSVDFSAFSAADQAAVTAESLRAYYPGESGADRWEIRPLTVENLDVVTGTADLVFSITQIVRPELMFRPVADPLDADDPLVFLDEVDVYWVRPDTTLANVLSGTCQGCADDAEAVDVSDAHVLIDDKVQSVVWVYGIPACVCITPVLDLAYLAGWPDSTFVRMDPKFERAVVALALANLGGICTCAHVVALAEQYAEDLSLQQSQGGPGGSSSRSYQSIPRVRLNPLGTTKGARVAWDIIVDDILGGPLNDYHLVSPMVTRR